MKENSISSSICNQFLLILIRLDFQEEFDSCFLLLLFSSSFVRSLFSSFFRADVLNYFTELSTLHFKNFL